MQLPMAMQKLIEYNAAVNHQDVVGWTALIYTAENGHSEAAISLLENNASVDVQDNEGFTALMEAASLNQLEVVSTLLEYEATVDIENDKGETALDIADREGHQEIGQLPRQRQPLPQY